MPELPEVEVTRMGIAPHIEGRTIVRMVVRQPQLRWRIEPALIKQLKNAQIMQTARRGKYLALLCACENGSHGALL
ncbi:MAG: formamidopyrimidine-DNA glycosylase, partial [Burkholderiales bacterium]|nr:formamidopyrimidine-DNA glycosylase [Burkholderiales bacterium]